MIFDDPLRVRAVNVIICLFAAAAAWLGPKDAAAQDALTGCPATAERAWVDDGVVSAIAIGPNCAQAALLLTLRDAQGDLLYVGAHHPQDLFGFEGAGASADAMAAALEEWIAGGGLERAGELPEWDDDAEGALGGEFPFYVEQWVDGALYTRIREENGPLFCFVQGMESMTCVGRYPEAFGSWVVIGVQSFPG